MAVNVTLCLTCFALVPLIQAGEQNGILRVVDNLVPVESRAESGDLASASELMTAIATGDIDTLSALIGSGVDPNTVLPSGDTPLGLAVAGGRREIVDMLLDAGADIEGRSSQGHTPLLIALVSGHGSIATTLIEKGADVLAKGADGITAAELALQVGDPDAMEAIAAALPERPVTAEEFLQAAEDGNVSVLKKGIASGLGSSADEDGWTALMLATVADRKDVVPVLLDAGVPVDARTREGHTALMIATVSGNEAVVGQLLRAGADIAVRNDAGMSVVDIAEVQELGGLVASFSEELNPSRERVAEVQGLLQQRGYEPGPADGVLGNNTREAILAYMSDHGLRMERLVSAALLHHLKTSRTELEAARPDDEETATRVASLMDLGLRLGRSGDRLVVAAVAEGTPAESANLKAGDVLLQVNQQDVSSLPEVKAAFGAWLRADRKSVLLLVEHQGNLRFVALAAQ